MLAGFDKNGDLLLRLQKGVDVGYLRAATAFALHARGLGLLADLREEGTAAIAAPHPKFTGIVTTQKGYRMRFVDGKPAPLGEDQPTQERGAARPVPANLNGEQVHVVGNDPVNKVVLVRKADGSEKVVRTDALDLGAQAAKGEEPAAEGEKPGGFEFYSPNTKEGAQFAEALASLGSAEQRNFLDTSDDVLDQIGVTHTGENAIGDWKDGAETSVMQTIDGPIDPASLRYSAAVIGKQARQKSVLAFLNNPEGKDSIYQIEIKAPIDEVRSLLG